MSDNLTELLRKYSTEPMEEPQIERDQALRLFSVTTRKTNPLCRIVYDGAYQTLEITDYLLRKLIKRYEELNKLHRL